MNSYKHRAMSIMGEPVVFSISEIPLRISEDEFVLALRRNSPILQISTIVRGSDSHDLFEGDEIRIDDTVFSISYNCGFVAISESKEMIQFKDLEDYDLISYGVYGNRSAMYKVRGEPLGLTNIIGCYGDFALVNKIKDKIDPSELQQDAGITLDKRRIFFGDIYNGRHVVMNYGRPSIEVDGEFIDITRKG